MEVVVLDVLTVVTLFVGEAKRAFLEDGINAVPESNRKTEPALIVADTQQTVFTPAVDT